MPKEKIQYIANVTISMPVEADDADEAYDIAYTQCANALILAASKNIYIERIEVSDA